MYTNGQDICGIFLIGGVSFRIGPYGRLGWGKGSVYIGIGRVNSLVEVIFQQEFVHFLPLQIVKFVRC